MLGVVIFYAGYQQVENAYLTPRIMRAAVDLPGIAVIVALTIGGEFAGFAGSDCCGSYRCTDRNHWRVFRASVLTKRSIYARSLDCAACISSSLVCAA